MAFFTAALVGAAVLGTAASIHSQKRAAQKQADAIRKQEEAARTRAAEQDALRNATKDTGAAVELGTDDRDAAAAVLAPTKGRSKRRSASTLGGMSVSAAAIGGL